MVRELKVSIKSLFIIWFFSYDLLYPVMSKIFNTTVSEWIFNIVLMALFLLVLSKNVHVLKKDTILLWIACGIFLGLTFLFHPEYAPVLTEGSYKVTNVLFSLHKGLFAYLVIRVEDDMDALFSDLKISAFVIWLSYSIRTINGVADVQVSLWTGQTVVSNYNQAYGYSFLFACIIFFYCMVKEKRIFAIPFMITIVQILMYASRTAILSLTVYIVLFLLFEGEEKQRTLKRISICILLLVLGAMFTSTIFLEWLRSVVSSFGVSSKIIDAFISGENTLDGGRAYLFVSGFEFIRTNFLGSGLFCDRYMFGMYVHNILIEIFMDFGWIVGGIIVIVLIRSYIKMFAAERCRYKTLFLMFFSLTIVRLMLSYSFWQDNNFWICIAIMVSYFDYIKNEKIGEYL